MFRAARLLAALLLTCLGLAFTATTTAAAADCTCKQATLDKQVAKADLVFTGTIDRVEAQGNGWRYDITASRTYQGTPERETQVLSAGGRDACGLGELGVGTSYIFFATGTETPYAADACGGTSVANPTRVDKVERLLGEGTAVEPPPPTAQLTMVEDAEPAGFARAAAPGAAAVLIGLLGLLVVRRLSRA